MSPYFQVGRPLRCLIAFLFLVSLAAGLYPAIIVISGFEPAKVLKGEVSTHHSGYAAHAHKYC
jgi:hypothetical protein